MRAIARLIEPTAPLRLLVEPGQRYFALYLFPQLVFAAWLMRRRRDRVGVIDRQVMTHRSTRHDLLLVVTNAVLVLPAIGIVLQGGRVVRPVRDAIEAVAGRHELLRGWPARVFITVVVALAADFGYFVAHYLEHRVPALWQVHRIHHSAPVMTPLTNGREHPASEMFHALFIVGASGAAAALSLALVTPGTGVVTIYGTNVVVMASFLLLANLRHSNAWVSFGPLVERVISSPAQHQIHHSTDVRHVDRNFAVVFSLWDWLFGTLVTTTSQREELRYGLRDEPQYDWTTSSIFLAPLSSLRRRQRMLAGRDECAAVSP
jgi:sterol desaturase/sphingolipid hydroxylase (fatty acid hydroxylase superfamily)